MIEDKENTSSSYPLKDSLNKQNLKLFSCWWDVMSCRQLSGNLSDWCFIFVVLDHTLYHERLPSFSQLFPQLSFNTRYPCRCRCKEMGYYHTYVAVWWHLLALAENLTCSPSTLVTLVVTVGFNKTDIKKKKKGSAFQGGDEQQHNRSQEGSLGDVMFWGSWQQSDRFEFCRAEKRWGWEHGNELCKM